MGIQLNSLARIRLLHDCIIIVLGHGIYITEFSSAGPYTNKAIKKKTRKKKEKRKIDTEQRKR